MICYDLVLEVDWKIVTFYTDIEKLCEKSFISE